LGILEKLFATGPRRVNVEKRFRLHNRVGTGSMSKVYRATDTETGRVVCLKILDKQQLELLMKRFVGLDRPTEGTISVSLRHPHVVRTYEHGMTTKGEEYLVMEYLEGTGLILMIESDDRRLRERRLDVLIAAGEGLAYFHEQGYIHRDVCPHNVMVGPDGSVKLIDFGLAVPNTPDFQKPGNRTGKVPYMAPELIARKATDQRIDVFGFGVTAYQTFTGRLPWGSTNSLENMLKHLNEPPRDPRDFGPQMDEETARVLLKALERDPKTRYQSMRELTDEFCRLRGDPLEEEAEEEQSEAPEK
jgi:serine/threonine protein kinase